MAELQKLRQFQISLMERKFQAVGKMDFISMVQLTCETQLVPVIKRVSVGNRRIYIDDGITVLPATRISHIVTHGNEVSLQFHNPLFGFGSTVTLTFSHENIKSNFLEALGDIGDESDQRDTSTQGSLTPPSSSEMDSD